ncbi:MAG: hypothetical protein IKV53_05565 [Clostridia bacterium]|nr:hypothetical protein [Clostridia bacterium]
MNLTYKEKYNSEYDSFMKEWAREVREWANVSEEQSVFFGDGIFDPDTWFSNEVRPLFVLKEVNNANDCEVTDDRIIKFVSVDGGDPWDGKTKMWKRFGIMAAIILQAYDSHTKPDFDKINEEMSIVRDGEETHKKICRRSAIINLKKLGGGGNTNSNKSKETLCFECHATRFHDNLIKQIEYIHPTVIICCGKDSVIEALGLGADAEIPTINTYHPAYRGDERDFFGYIVEELEKHGVV